MSQLADKAMKSLMWSFAEASGFQFLKLVINIILARLLSPGDFGVIGMLAIFISLCQNLSDSGFSQSLIRNVKADTKDFTTVFYYNLSISVLLYCIMFFTAGLIADFYAEPILKSLTKIAALNLVLNSFGLIQQTLLIKAINFKKSAIINLNSTLVGGVVAIVLALMGAGVWSLVAQTLTASFLKNTFLWLSSDWRPERKISRLAFEENFSFGSKVMMVGFINTIFNNIYSVVIGKRFSSTELGYYTQALRLQAMPLEVITSSILNVTYPVLSNFQNDAQFLRDKLFNILKLMTFMNLPILALLAITAKPLVLLLLTEKWASSINFIIILGFQSLIYPIDGLYSNILKVRGKANLFLAIEIAKKLFIVAAIIITIRMSLIYVIVGQVVAYYFGFILNASVITASMKMNLLHYASYFIKMIILTFTSAIISYIIGLSYEHQILVLFSNMLIMILLFILFVKLFEIEELSEALKLIRSQFSQNRDN